MYRKVGVGRRSTGNLQIC